MESLLTPLQTKSKPEVKEDLLKIPTLQSQRLEREILSINSPEDALEALRSKPNLRLLAKTLRWLTIDSDKDHVLFIKRPSPKAAQIIFALVNDIVPNYWQLLNADRNSSHPKEKRMLITCLRSVAGIGAIACRLRIFITQLKDSQGQPKVPIAARAQPMYDLLEVLEVMLEGEESIALIWRDIDACLEVPLQKSLQWKELLSLLASGRMLSIASEASFLLNDTSLTIGDSSWIGNGNRYSAWLGRNVQFMNKELPTNAIEGQKALTQLFSKALNLGYKDQVIKSAFSDLLSGDENSASGCRALISKIPVHEQKAVLFSVIAVVSEGNSPGSSNSEADGSVGLKALRGVSALVAALVGQNFDLQAGLSDWLIGVSANAAGQSHMMHRAVIAVVANTNEQLLNALRKGFELFGDKLYIKHTPILHQEVTTQILLMLAGYVFRNDRTELLNLSRSSIYLNAISNRLGASSPRARFLGMIVGTAVSELIDAQDKRMNFGTDDLKSPDGLWYRGLTSINDAVGSIADLKVSPIIARKATKRATKPATSTATSKKLTGRENATSKIISIEEIHDSSDSDGEDLPMYEKPDSDPSDEDEDPTLVQRDRPTAPVYIRDLIDGLHNTENFDRHKLALINAANLIRRKATFGSEVSDNIEELATLLVGLSDKWEMEDFQKSRLQGMIAILIAEPLKMGQWFSKTFYNGDYSMGQRASVLTTLGMAARELAGLGKEDAALTGANVKENAFPPKRLPDKLHKIYALEAAPMNVLSAQLEKTMIQPMAASAADQITGPNALKVRTFSSRMAVENRRQKPIPNALAKIVAEGFFFPLTGRWRIHLQTYGENSSHTDPFLLAHFLKTLSLILHASGSSTLSLPQMTCEFWDFLLSLRPRAADPSVLEALLFAFLTLLDINENDQRRLAQEHAKELLETQGWVENVFERVGGGSDEGDKIRMLAAGVLLRTREVVEKYQRMLMGDMVDYV